VLGEDFASLVRVLRVRAGLAPACESLRPSCDAERELAAAAASFERGLDVIGENYSPAGRCASLPPRAWQRESLWYEAAQPAVSEHTRDRAAAVRPSAEWFAWLRAAAKEARIAALASYLKPLVQEQLGLPDELEIARTQSLFDLGISSVNALALGARIQADFELKASPTLLYDCPNLDALASWIAAELMPESACERKLT
jgi:acyl carrier protein